MSALVEVGEVDRARKLCERLLSYASPLELYAEEIDAKSGRHLGNFPQAFTHLALINAVVHVIRAEGAPVVFPVPTGVDKSASTNDSDDAPLDVPQEAESSS